MGGAIALAVGIGHSTSQTSEIDAYEAAVRSQSKTEALSFIKNFGSSHLVGDLIESLPPEVAQQVCTDLQGSGPARARQACEALREALAVQPDAQTAAIPPAAGAAVIVNPIPAGTDASEGVHSQKKAEDVQDESDTDDAGGTDLPAVPTTRNSAQLEPASTSADTSTTAPSGLEPQADKDSGVSSSAGDADLFYLPVATAAPAGEIAEVAPVSTASVVATTSPQLADEPRGDQGTSDTDKSDGANVFLRVARTAPAARTTGASSALVSTPASTGVPTGDATVESNSTQGTSAQTNTQSGSDKGSSSAQSSKSDQSDNGKKGSVKTTDTQSSTPQDGAQSTSAQSSSGAQSNSDQGNSDQSGSSTQSSSTQSSSSQSSSSSAQSSSGKKGDGKKSSDQSGKGKGGKGKGGKD
jgi:hypothetical protein